MRDLNYWKFVAHFTPVQKPISVNVQANGKQFLKWEISEPFKLLFQTLKYVFCNFWFCERISEMRIISGWDSLRFSMRVLYLGDMMIIF
jgi:hypothetical protein